MSLALSGTPRSRKVPARARATMPRRIIMRTCERIFTTPPDGDQRVCGLTATHLAYGDTPLCSDCLHACFEDEPVELYNASVLEPTAPCERCSGTGLIDSWECTLPCPDCAPTQTETPAARSKAAAWVREQKP